MGTSLAQHIVEQCSITVASKNALSIRGISEEDFELLKEYMTDECQAVVDEPTEIPHGTSYKVSGHQGDNVTLTYYENSTFMMQGVPLLLHSQIIEFLSDILDLENVVQAQLTQIKTGIKSDEVLLEMSGYLPTSFDELDSTIKALISPSIALSKLNIELDDYAVIAFPALRGLEAYVKDLFARKGIIINRDGFAPYLNPEYHATLSDGSCMRIACEKTCTAINRCYGYYKDQRHGLFHASGILANTRILSVRQDAINVVNQVLRLIEESEQLIRG